MLIFGTQHTLVTSWMLESVSCTWKWVSRTIMNESKSLKSKLVGHVSCSPCYGYTTVSRLTPVTSSPFIVLSVRCYVGVTLSSAQCRHGCIVSCFNVTLRDFKDDEILIGAGGLQEENRGMMWIPWLPNHNPVFLPPPHQ